MANIEACNGSHPAGCVGNRVVHVEVKINTVPGWRGRFCYACFGEWIGYQRMNHGKVGDKVTATFI